MTDILSSACSVTSAFVNKRSKAERKSYGQFFTSQRTAEFMSSLFCIDFNKPSISILDAGAGTGILSTALVKRIRDAKYKGNITFADSI